MKIGAVLEQGVDAISLNPNTPTSINLVEITVKPLPGIPTGITAEYFTGEVFTPTDIALVEIL